MFRKRPRDDNSESKELVAQGQGATPPSVSVPLQARLDVTAGPDKGQTHELTRMITLVGRDASCDVAFAEEAISREHGQFEQHLNEWVYTNLSDNGTWINHKKVERLVLKDGDTIEIGAETRMKFRLSEPEQVEVTAAPRRRVRVRDQEAAEEEQEEIDHPTMASAAGGLLKRRKLLVAIGVYFMVMVVIAVLATSSGNKNGRGPRGAVEAWDSYGEIENALDMTFPEYQYNPVMANRLLEEAKLLHQRWPYGDKGDLYESIKSYQESYYYRGQTWQDYRDRQDFDKAKTKLRDVVWQLYGNALLEEYKQNYDSARRYYIEIQRHVPDEKNPIFRHVQRRIQALAIRPS
ncbi:MAG: FHA domain-containing protein [Planctomycetes bacterium]|nr:FHA domain-containing protein [Planctomycetota bacterium]